MHVRLSKFLQELLSVLCTLTLLAASQEHYLRFNFTTGLLHFRCPLDSDLKDKNLVVAILGRYNQRTTSGKVSQIASWYNNASTTYENTGNVVLNTRQSGLTGYLTDVRCEDSLTYYCEFHLYVQRGPLLRHLETFTSTPEGPPSVSIERLQNVHPCPGDKMELKCRAFLGRQTNSIVWESRPPGGQFVLDTDSYTNHSTPVDTKSCNYYSESTLSRDLTAADHRREWRCRLSYGHAADNIIIAMNSSCLTVQSEGTTTPPPFTSPQLGNSSEDSPWGKATFFFVVLVMTTAVVFLIFRRKMIQFKNPNSESRENFVTDQESGTTWAHSNEAHTPAANHLEPHSSPIPFNDVIGEDGYATVFDDGLDHDPRPSDPLDLQDINCQTPAAASLIVDPGYSGLDDDAADYNMLVYHGNSDVTISLASAAESNYKQLDISAFLASSPACESDRDE